MNITVNGAPLQVAGTTLEQVLGELGYGAAKVATALDGDFVPARHRPATALVEGSVLEILAPMQGG